MGRPLYSKASAASTAATSPRSPAPAPGSPASSLSSNSSSSTVENIHYQHALDALVPEKWSAYHNNFDPDSEEFWAGENTVYEAFLTADPSTLVATVDGTVSAPNTDLHVNGVGSQPMTNSAVALAAALRTRDEMLRSFAIQDQNNRYDVAGGMINVPRPGGGTMWIPYPTVGPTSPNYESAGAESTPASPTAESYGINPSPMAVGGDDPARLFSEWERAFLSVGRQGDSGAGSVAPTGPVPAPPHMRPGPLSLSIPTVHPSATENGPPTGGSTAAMTVLTPTSPVGRIGAGLGGSRRMRRASAAAANAGWTSSRVGAGSGAQGYTNPVLPASPTTGPNANTRRSSRGWNAQADDAQLPITMDITPIPIPIPSTASRRHHAAAFIPASPPAPIPVPITPPPDSPPHQSTSTNPITPGVGGGATSTGSAAVSPAVSMMFTPSPAPTVTPRFYHWDWQAYTAHHRGQPHSHRRHLPTASLPPMPVSPTTARSSGGGGVPMSHIVTPMVRIGHS
jgi:hypothetical protein